MSEIKVEGLAVAAEVIRTSVETPSEPLFESRYMVSSLRKALETKPDKAAISNQGRLKGRVPHPFDFEAAQNLINACHIHEVCIFTKRDSIVGLGFETEEEAQQRARKRELENAAHAAAIAGDPKAKPPGGPPKDKPVAKELPMPPASDKPKDPAQQADLSAPKPRSKVEEVLDPLCDDGFQSLLNQLGEDYVTGGRAYLEVVRQSEGGPIIGLWHMPAGRVFRFNEDEKPFFHYEVDDYHDGGARALKYARWMDAQRVRSKVLVSGGQEKVTELIEFKQISARQRDYGLPDYFGCVPWLELAQFVMQYDFDYFQNRAVPDLLVMLTGKKVAPEEMKQFVESLKSTVGGKNRHRSIVANFSAPDLVATVERLTADNRERFGDLWSAIQLAVVSAHRVPPLLAGVSLPGKMAAANELPNALIAFQTLYVDQQQQVFERVFGRTLGSDEAGLGLQPNDFRLRKITDAYDMGQVDTMSRMRETTTEAQMSGRKLEDGLKQ